MPLTELEVIEAINTAIFENYYTDMESWSNEDIAIDICAYHPDGGDHVPEDPELLKHIEAWRKQWPEAKAKEAEASAKRAASGQIK